MGAGAADAEARAYSRGALARPTHVEECDRDGERNGAEG